ncbi:MAG: MFS transporter [Promethearchaeati archaeon SRVP18_Atabeyarchaeia-1]
MKASHKLWYGIGPLGAQIALRLVEFAPLNFYEANPLVLIGLYAGIALALSKITIMISQFAAGALSDRLKGTRYGRRKPFVITGIPFLALSMILLFSPTYFLPTSAMVPDANAGSYQIPLFLYMTIAVCMVNFWYGWISTPYQSWMPELTEPEERVRLSTILNTTNMIGTAIGILIAFTFPSLIKAGSWGLILEIMFIASMVQIVFYIPSILKLLESHEKQIKTPSIRREFRVITANKNYLAWIVCQGLLSVAFISIQSMVLGFVQYVLNFSTTIDYIIFGAVFIVVVILSFLIWMLVIRKVGRKSSFTFAMLFLTAVLPFSLLIGWPGVPIPLFWQGFIYVALVAFNMSGYMIFPYVIMSDIAHEDEIKTGEARAGIYMGFNSIPLNLFQALGFFISGILTWNVAFPGNTGYRAFGPVLAIFLLMGALALQHVKVDFNFKQLEKEHGGKRVAKET